MEPLGGPGGRHGPEEDKGGLEWGGENIEIRERSECSTKCEDV